MPAAWPCIWQVTSAVVRLVSSLIRLSINGAVTVDYTEEDPEIARDGIIAVQVHSGPPMEVQFRKIRIKELAAE